MQCLYTASEDNPEAQEKIRGKTVEFEAVMGAQDASSPPELYLRILSVGVVINAADSATEELSEATWRLVVSIIAKLMDVDQRKMVRILSRYLRCTSSIILKLKIPKILRLASLQARAPFPMITARPRRLQWTKRRLKQKSWTP